MKLHELRRNNNTKLYGLQNKAGEDLTIIFGSIDGSYSNCWLEGNTDAVIHLHANSTVVPHKDGYKVIEETT